MTSDPSPRVLMTADAVGGVWVYATSLAEALARRGCSVLLVTLGPPPRPDQLTVLGSLGNVEVESTDLALEWMDPEGTDRARAERQLSSIARRFSPDIVHLSAYRDALATWTVPVVVTAHSCVRTWWRACRGDDPSELHWRSYMANVEAGLNAADAWVAPTRAFADSIRLAYAPSSPGRVIHNGVGRIDAPTWKRDLVLSAGRLWDEAKNVTALAPVSQAFDWPIRLAGASQSDRNRADLGGRLELLGELPRPALLEQMRQSAVFVAPARYEPFGLSVLEAAACGCALVLSDIGTFRELWDGAALFVDPDDSDDIARTLATLRADPALRTRLQAAARRRADRYSAVAMQARYRELYRELTSSAGTANATALVGAAEARP